MSVLRSVPFGAVCLLYAAILSATPVTHPSPPVVAPAPSLASSSLQEAMRRIWQASTEVQAARSEENTSELQSLMRKSYAVFCLKKQHTTSDVSVKIKII